MAVTKTRISVPPRERVRLRGGHRTLSIPRRIASTFVDAVLVLLLSGFGAQFASVDPVTGTADPRPALIGLLIGLVGLAWWNGSTGRSPGKKLVGGRLIVASNAAQPVGFLRALVRIGFNVIPFGFWTILGTSRRTAHDHLTDTVVVRVPR